MPLPWWLWILIALGVALIGFLKIKVWKSMGKKSTRSTTKDED